MNLLVEIAKEEALKCFHGYVSKVKSNIDEIIKPFPKWTRQEADGNWCAAFVYYCCNKAGYVIPVRPKECISCNLAGCGAWEEWAITDERIEYYKWDNDVVPCEGDIVLFDRVFNNSEHDHIGIVVEVKEKNIIVAEGNFNNVSCIVERPRKEHIRAYIRVPEGFVY